MAEILLTGARVNKVDEEGEVSLYCFSLDRWFSFRVDPTEATRWGALLGKALVIRVYEGEDDALLDLYECEECSSKPGSPTLCRGCVERRNRVGALWRGARPRRTSAKNGSGDD